MSVDFTGLEAAPLEVCSGQPHYIAQAEIEAQSCDRKGRSHRIGAIRRRERG
jgi:hypothetical protein